jgi:hypothetical protein
MANLGDLKTRIISETVRDDLADDLKAQFDGMIRGAIEEWATQHFYFNQARVTVNTVAGDELVILPPTIRVVDSMWINVGGARYDLYKRSLDEITDLQISPTEGQPSDWCDYQGNAILYPTPNIVYPMTVICVQDVLPPLDFASDVSENHWTNVGADLITATTKKRLYRDYLSAIVTDPRLQNALVQERNALSDLTARSNRKIATGRVRAGW